jgi:hypothetical protein
MSTCLNLGFTTIALKPNEISVLQNDFSLLHSANACTFRRIVKPFLCVARIHKVLMGLVIKSSDYFIRYIHPVWAFSSASINGMNLGLE